MYAFEPKFRHVLTSEIHVVEISYKGDGFSMIIVSPRKIGGLKEVEYSLTADSFKQWRDTMTLIQYAKIQLPMFTINSNYDDILKSSLVKLGTSNVFAPNVSNFYKLSDKIYTLIRLYTKHSSLSMKRAISDHQNIN